MWELRLEVMSLDTLALQLQGNAVGFGSEREEPEEPAYWEGGSSPGLSQKDLR